MENIHLLTTDKPSRLIQAKDDELMLLNELYENTYNINKHIYITSDEEIKDGDRVYCKHLNCILQFKNPSNRHFYKKIILTTDQDLIKDGVQAIDDEVLEWFVKNPTCEFVEVKQLLSNNGNAFFGYKIIIPKEKQKQILSEMMQEDEKSGLYDETIEQVAQEYSKYLDDFSYKDFYAGALYQQKQTYSKQQTFELMKQAFEAGFKKADTVEAGLEPKETEQEINWILTKFKNK